MMSRALILLAVTALLACSNEIILQPDGAGGSGATTTSGPTTGATGGNVGVTVGSGGAGAATQFSTTIGPFEVMPGDEQTMCVIVDLGNPNPGMLRSVSAHLTEGSHHLIVTKIDDGVAMPTPTACGAFAHGGDALFIAEKPETTLTYPDGSGLPFVAHQLIGLEMHFLNYTGEPLQISGTVDFALVDDDTPLDEVHLLFVGDPGLYIPAMSQAVSQSNHSVPTGAQVFAMTSHMHSLGTYATITRTPNGELLHESDSWSEPPFDVYQPALTFEPGEGLQLTCNYDNPTTQDVSFGTGFYDEMCFLWAHYILKP